MKGAAMQIRISEFRSRNDLTQIQLANLINRSHRTIQSWESGKSYPNAEDVVHMCDIFGCDPNTLLGFASHPISADEWKLLKCYRSCNSRQQERALEDIKERSDLSKDSE